MEKYGDAAVYDAVVIGAGPAGMAAAITLKNENPKANVLLLEKMKEPAKKLSASGNGRGNLSNLKCEDLESVLKFFSETGIALRTDDEGRIYPYSEDARAVTSALAERVTKDGAELRTDTQVINVEACSEDGASFRVFISSKAVSKDGDRKNGVLRHDISLRTKKVLIASGGKSYGVYGSTGDGYKMARCLGHNVIPPVPGLTAIETEEPLKTLAGIRVKGEVSLFKDGDMIFREKGEIQFREDCISGICVMNMSSMLPAAAQPGMDNRFEGHVIRINLVPDLSVPALIGFLKENNMAEDHVKVPATLVKKAIADEIERRAKIAGQGSVLDIANQLRGFTLTPTGRKGWKEAQVTRGGVALEEIDMMTMESKLVPGLYFAGEVTDYDGPCGGFNLNNAFLTGIRAGHAMAEAIVGTDKDMLPKK